MSKTVVRYVCQSCGAEHPKWSGRCADCGAWNTLEEVASAASASGKSAAVLSTAPITEIAATESARASTGSPEFDRVLGGGLVPGSLVLLGGEPGIGKSTLLLQFSGRLSNDVPVLYVSGEESAEQVALRAKRLAFGGQAVRFAAATDIDRVIQTVLSERPGLLVLDSIQSMQTDQVSSGPGSVTQVRECAARVQTVAKAHGISVILVGHVTKEGGFAGPKVLEHLVDVVLYLEGERYHGHRLLRGAKNRFGPTDEVGVFQMAESGLVDETNPAGVFIDQRSVGAPGSAVTASLEGTRVLLTEVQALGVETAFGYPKRTASGYDLNKLHVLLAVLSKHAGIPLGSTDVYCNIGGGFRLSEPAGDVAVALAVASAVRHRPLPERTLAIGELGLSGEVRPVISLGKRLEEAARAGFAHAVVPKQETKVPKGLRLTKVPNVAAAVSQVVPKETPRAAQ